MKNTENQHNIEADNRRGADECRIDAGAIRTLAETTRIEAETTVSNVVVNLAQINISNIVVSNTASYKNGSFLPVFQDAMRAIACNPHVKPGTRRVLEYLLGTVDEKNCFSENLTDIADHLSCSIDTVERAIAQLIDMHVVCKIAGARGRSTYELSDKILNPRVGFKGNTRELRKESLPELLTPQNRAPLIPSFFTEPDFD